MVVPLFVLFGVVLAFRWIDWLSQDGVRDANGEKGRFSIVYIIGSLMWVRLAITEVVLATHCLCQCLTCTSSVGWHLYYIELFLHVVPYIPGACAPRTPLRGEGLGWVRGGSDSHWV